MPQNLVDCGAHLMLGRPHLLNQVADAQQTLATETGLTVLDPLAGDIATMAELVAALHNDG